MRHTRIGLCLAIACLTVAACGDDSSIDSGTRDAGMRDGSSDRDAAVDASVGDTSLDALPDGDLGDAAADVARLDAATSFGSTIGAVGCSNTNQAVMGYLEVSTVDSMINTAQGGQAMREWMVASGGPWDRYEAMRPAAGFSAVWLNLCQRAADGLDQTIVDTIIANIRARDPDAPIIISPLNFYEEESCAVTNGNEIPNAGATLADDTASTDPDVFRGPDLGPFPTSMLRDDECHLNAAGITRAGEQLQTFFDG